ncbi:MAG: aminoacyl-tRNA hydrolase [Planctomycetota bacterium]|nr:MAG: aminoacyl-tRNA hydrolase [Planctomycetota bacterium]REJ98488.1 MAG: aminoacyl-tRNA hydrolase [Planctomycetota bacterium]REK23598.1 MAG: aminoacyl-tRNA hydrolase [Planctomycetota bacterium]REK31177.1 MAG: aminoacyl-tRNA hydrolase [Planctomycetota bacterium]
MSSAPSTLTVSRSIRIPLSEFEFSFARSSGPGGQNVNKVNSKVQLRWDLAGCESMPEQTLQRFRTLNRRRINSDGVFQISSQRFRDQSRNKSDCLEKLRELILAAHAAPKKRKPTRVPRSAHARRLEAKRQRSQRKAGRRKPGLDD